MGLSLCWLAARGLDGAELRSRLGLQASGRRAAFLAEPLAGCALEGGWQLVLARGSDHPLVAPATLRALPPQATVVSCSVEEHVMAAAAEGWQQGQRQWRIVHDAQQAPRHLVAEGALPAAYAGALAAVRQAQDREDAGPREVDHFFDLPVRVAAALTGFAHDEDHPALDGAGFEVLTALPGTALATRRRWWRWWA